MLITGERITCNNMNDVSDDLRPEDCYLNINDRVVYLDSRCNDNPEWVS